MIHLLKTPGAVAIAAAAFAFSGPVGAAEPENPDAPYAPFRIADGFYYVGSADYSSYLIATDAGLIVIDGGDARTGRQVVGNIRTLGFRPADVRILLNTHAHFDHAAGLAEIRLAAPRAKLYASAADGAILAAGGRGDPYLKGAEWSYPPVKPDVTLTDGQQVTLGGWTLTAHLTGGHTKGCTTWTFPVTVAGKVRQALDHCSSSVLGHQIGPTETYPGQTADYERSFATWKRLPCEVFVASHASSFNMAEKRALLAAGKADAFVDPAGCKAYYAREEANFRAELAAQKR